MSSSSINYNHVKFRWFEIFQTLLDYFYWVLYLFVSIYIYVDFVTCSLQLGKCTRPEGISAYYTNRISML